MRYISLFLMSLVMLACGGGGPSLGFVGCDKFFLRSWGRPHQAVGYLTKTCLFPPK